MTNLADKLVLITGASSGIGAACAQAFAQAGTALVFKSQGFGRMINFGPAMHRMVNDLSFRLATWRNAN